MDEKTFEYDVGLSFAGEQRDYVDHVAGDLRSRGIRPFYDDYERGALWGKDLYAHLTEVYQHKCEYCVIFVSQEYAAKVWPNRERQSAQARALEENREYILPARFDDTPIPGLLNTVGFIDLNQTTPKELSDLIAEKLGKQTRVNYMPPNLDRLYENLDIIDDPDAKTEAFAHAHAFFQALRRMSSEERDAVISLIRFGCPADLPDNIHIHTDLLRRHTGKSVARLESLLGDVRSLGFRCSLRENTSHETDTPEVVLGDYDFFYLEWLDLTGEEEEIPALWVVREMIYTATEAYCEEHGAEFLERLDFSQLASATFSVESDVSEH